MYPFQFSRMSLATAIIGLDGIVLASDSVETEIHGDYQRYNAHKIERITDSVWMSCVSNYASFTNCLIDDFLNDIGKQTLKERKQLDIRLVTRHFESYAYTESMKFQQKDSKKMFPYQHLREQIEIIIAGYTNDIVPEPKLRISGFFGGSPTPPFMPREETFYSSGTTPIAMYWMHKINRVKPLNSMDSQTLRMFTMLIFIETIKLTRFVGAPLDIVTIRPTGIADKITISEAELSGIQSKLDTVVGEKMILDKLAELANKIGNI